MILKSILKITALCILFANIVFAIEKDNISSFMESNINKVTEILQYKDVSLNKKAAQIFPLLDKTFDYELMSRLSLGQKVWLEITDEQKIIFTERFVTYMKNSYIDKLELYTDEKLNILELKEINAKRIWLLTELVNSKEKYDITYKFYPSDENNWLIYDVNIIGVSLMQTYRAQFSDILKENSFDELVKKLESKIK